MVFCGTAPHCHIYLKGALKCFPICLCFINPWSRLTTFFNFVSSQTQVLLTFTVFQVTKNDCENVVLLHSLRWLWFVWTVRDRPHKCVWLQNCSISMPSKGKGSKYILCWLADASLTFIKYRVRGRGLLLSLNLASVCNWIHALIRIQCGRFMWKRFSHVITILFEWKEYLVKS